MVTSYYIPKPNNNKYACSRKVIDNIPYFFDGVWSLDNLNVLEDLNHYFIKLNQIDKILYDLE